MAWFDNFVKLGCVLSVEVPSLCKTFNKNVFHSDATALDKVPPNPYYIVTEDNEKVKNLLLPKREVVIEQPRVATDLSNNTSLSSTYSGKGGRAGSCSRPTYLKITVKLGTDNLFSMGPISMIVPTS